MRFFMVRCGWSTVWAGTVAVGGEEAFESLFSRGLEIRVA